MFRIFEVGNDVKEIEEIAMKTILLIFALALSASPAFAAPVVDLTCRVAGPNGGSATDLDITLNEATGTASYVVKTTGALFTQRAQFTPFVVTIGDRDGVIVIDRRTLEIRDGVMFNGELRVFRSGTCEIAKPADRKF